MMFGDIVTIVTIVVISRGPVVLELFLTDLISKPVVLHVHGFEFFHDIIVHDAKGGGVVMGFL